jgi:hypothetical protein
MPARLMAAKPWKSFSIREQPGWNGMAAAVQKHTQWLDVHIATLVNRSGVFVISGENYWVVLDPTDVIMASQEKTRNFVR